MLPAPTVSLSTTACYAVASYTFTFTPLRIPLLSTDTLRIQFPFSLTGSSLSHGSSTSGIFNTCAIDTDPEYVVCSSSPDSGVTLVEGSTLTIVINNVINGNVGPAISGRLVEQRQGSTRKDSNTVGYAAFTQGTLTTATIAPQGSREAGGVENYQVSITLRAPLASGDDVFIEMPSNSFSTLTACSCLNFQTCTLQASGSSPFPFCLFICYLRRHPFTRLVSLRCSFFWFVPPRHPQGLLASAAIMPLPQRLQAS